MLFRNIVGRSRIWSPRSWLLGTFLWLAMGPVLAQEIWGSFSQPYIAARSAVLMNPDTGEILFAKEPHLRLPPASTTKVLTALLVIERLDPNSRLPVSPRAASAAPSRIGLHAGETASTQDLLYGLLLKSGNDAAETLAEAAGGSIYGFADLMNAKAWQIGARNSHFMNPHGLPDEDHYSTAYDLALIFRHAMNYPMFTDIVRTRNAALRIESGRGGWYGDGRLVPVRNTNRLLESYEGARGGKTGFTLKARRCFVGEVDRGGVRLIVSILNSPNSGTLWQDARTLLDYGFARYGLAPPPPAQPEIEPQPILVRRTPIPTTIPKMERIAMIRPAVEDDEPEPVLTRRHFSTTRLDSSRAIMARPAAVEKNRNFVPPQARYPVAPTKLATPAKPTKTRHPLAAAKLVTPAKPTVPGKRVASAKPAAPAKSARTVKGQLANTRSTARTTSMIASAKPPATNVRQGTQKAGKPNKPAATAAATTPTSKASKAIARAEPSAPKPSPKNAKRRI